MRQWNTSSRSSIIRDPVLADTCLSYHCHFPHIRNTLIFSISVEDFNPEPVMQVISSDATDNTGSIELDFRIALVDDAREERKESFFLWLNASTSDDRDSVMFTAGRRCIRVDISPDGDGEELVHEGSSSCPGLPYMWNPLGQ